MGIVIYLQKPVNIFDNKNMIVEQNTYLSKFCRFFQKNIYQLQSIQSKLTVFSLFFSFEFLFTWTELTKRWWMWPESCLCADNARFTNQWMAFITGKWNQCTDGVFAMIGHLACTLNAGVDRNCWLSTLNCCSEKWIFIIDSSGMYWNILINSPLHRGTAAFHVPSVWQLKLAGPLSR